MSRRDSKDDLSGTLTAAGKDASATSDEAGTLLASTATAATADQENNSNLFDTNEADEANLEDAAYNVYNEVGYDDDEVDNLDLDSLIQTELNNEKSEADAENSYELFGMAHNPLSPLKLHLNSAYYKADSPSAVSESTTSSLSSLKTATVSNSNVSNLAGFDEQSQSAGLSDNSFSTICEDDLVDHRAALRQMFMKDLFEKYECICDIPMGQFVTKRTKLSKSLQRKLANLYQLLHQPAPTDATDGIDQMTIDRLIAQSPNSPIYELICSLQNNMGAAGENGGKDLEALKAVSIYNIIQNQEYKKKLFRSMRSIAERICIDALAICDQYHNQLQQQEQILQASVTNGSGQIAANPINYSNPTTKLWSEVRSRGCQFLGPQMQDDVLRLILHALETMTRMSRKLLVLYVVFMLKKHYPKASKTSVGHVVQLLYRAGCFKVEKRENDSSLMELKKEFSKYPALRRQHDSQIIQIALESGIRMSPEQWSQKLFGDATHKSEMQSIIDKLHSQQTLEKLASDFYEKLNTNISASSSLLGNNNSEAMINNIFLKIKGDFDYLASINFEKKLPVATKSASQEKALNAGAKSSKKTHAIDSIGMSSGAESLASDTDSNLDHNDRDLSELNEDDEFFDFQSSEELKAQKQALQQEQTKIVWPLLKESLHKAISILGAYIEYSSKMLAIIIANNNYINSNSNAANGILGAHTQGSNVNAAGKMTSKFLNQSDLSSSNGSINLIPHSGPNKGSLNMRPNGSNMAQSRGGGYQNQNNANFKSGYLKQASGDHSNPYSMNTVNMKFKPSQNDEMSGGQGLFMGSDTSFDNNGKFFGAGGNRSNDKFVMHALIQQMGPNSMKPSNGSNNYMGRNGSNQFGNNSPFAPKQYNNSKKNPNGFGQQGGGNYYANNYQNNMMNGGGGGGFNSKLGNQANDTNNNMFAATNFFDFQDMQKNLFDSVNLGMMMPPPGVDGYNAFGGPSQSLFDPAQLNKSAK